MDFQSILFSGPSDDAQGMERPLPAHFVDLNLDQIERAIIAGREFYNLAPFFRAPLHDVDGVSFRQSVVKDLEKLVVFDAVKEFTRCMEQVRERFEKIEKSHYRLQKQWWFLDAVCLYSEGIHQLEAKLAAAGCKSRAFLGFKNFLNAYIASAAFTQLVESASQLKAHLAAIRYTIYIKGGHVEIREPTEAEDYILAIGHTFERFRQAAAKEYSFSFSDYPEMNHIEARVLDGVAYLNQELFGEVAEFYTKQQEFIDGIVRRFDREVQFYVAYLEYIAPLKALGLPFSYPRVSDASKKLRSIQSFDLALAHKLAGERKVPVRNDMLLEGQERIIVVSGPNQGGKTTFARTFGQLHHLSALGFPVPGTAAELYLPDQIFTHFERREQLANLRGKLEDDVFRIHEIVEAATPRSVVVINEIFTSTTLRDALFLSKKIAQLLMDLDVLCVWVTFLDELASLGPATVSMTSTVLPDNPAERTFRIVRRPADGLAYAMSIAKKYRLTHDAIRERIRHESASSLS